MKNELEENLWSPYHKKPLKLPWSNFGQKVWKYFGFLIYGAI